MCVIIDQTDTVSHNVEGHSNDLFVCTPVNKENLYFTSNLILIELCEHDYQLYFVCVALRITNRMHCI